MDRSAVYYASLAGQTELTEAYLFLMVVAHAKKRGDLWRFLRASRTILEWFDFFTVSYPVLTEPIFRRVFTML
jgi:hypothetical protein